jgi:hypothetical protein
MPPERDAAKRRAPEAGRWNEKIWIECSPPLPRVIARQADRAVGEQGEESSEWRGRQIRKWWRLEGSVLGGFGEEKKRTFGFPTRR